MTSSEPLGLRDRKKVRLRAALAETAMRLFVERGYDGVTVDEIAAAADVSRRTFFRYFPTKEAVVMARREDQATAFRDALASAGDAAPFESVRAALLALADDYARMRERILVERALVRANASLVAADLELDRALEEIIAEHFLAHSRRAVAEKRRARIAAAAIVGAVRVVIDEWADRDGEFDLARVGVEALELLEPLAPRGR